MNIRGEASEQIWSTVIYLLLAVLFLAGMFVYLSSQRNGATTWEDFYAKEISKIMNVAQPGDEITLNIQTATQIAAKSQITVADQMFNFDNVNKQICVKLSAGRESCYSYFNNINALNWKIEYGVPNDVLVIKVGAAQ